MSFVLFAMDNLCYGSLSLVLSRLDPDPSTVATSVLLSDPITYLDPDQLHSTALTS